MTNETPIKISLALAQASLVKKGLWSGACPASEFRLVAHGDADGEGQDAVLLLLLAGGLDPGGLHQTHRAVNGVEEKTHIPDMVDGLLFRGRGRLRLGGREQPLHIGLSLGHCHLVLGDVLRRLHPLGGGETEQRPGVALGELRLL